MGELEKIIQDHMPNLELKQNVALSSLTSFHIGGPADLTAYPSDERDLSMLFKLSAGWQRVIIGAGSNILAADEGFRGLVIRMREHFTGTEQLPDKLLRVYAGTVLAQAAVRAQELGLTGMEFAHGIPGTMGGAVYMNAGAYSGEIADITESVRCMDEQGNIIELPKNDCEFSYRSSAFQKNGLVILSCDLKLEPGDPRKIRERMQELAARRRASQPLDYPSAGSTFKRPAGGYAAALIDQAGLKGMTVGGAQVSEKHAGFVINKGGASCEDVLQLTAIIQQKVFENSGIRLEPEIRCIGRQPKWNF